MPVEEAELTIETLPVTLAMPAGAGKLQWERVRPQVTELKQVAIAGPRSVIERIKAADAPGGLRAAALLTLDPQDWNASIVIKSVELSPAGVGIRFVGPAPTVRVDISR